MLQATWQLLGSPDWAQTCMHPVDRLLDGREVVHVVSEVGVAGRRQGLEGAVEVVRGERPRGVAVPAGAAGARLAERDPPESRSCRRVFPIAFDDRRRTVRDLDVLRPIGGETFFARVED